MTLQHKRQVCLFGLSANPPTGHGGHGTIVSTLASLTCENNSAKNLFDEVRVLPVYKHMFSSKQDQADYDHRLEMCRLTFSNIPNCIVSDQERALFKHVAAKREIISEEGKMKMKLGTSDLLDYLHELNEAKEPKEEYTLAMGADTFMDLINYKWRRPKDIIKMVGGRFVVKLRDHSNSVNKADILNRINEVNSDLENEAISIRLNVHLIHEAVTNVSSSAARSTSDEEELSRYVHSDVIDYIKHNKLYKFCDKFNP